MLRKRILKAISSIIAGLMICTSLTGCGADTALKETNELNIFNLVDDTIPMKNSGFYSVLAYDYQAANPEVKLDYRTSDLDDAALTFGGGITNEMADYLQNYYDTVSINIMK